MASRVMDMFLDWRSLAPLITTLVLFHTAMRDAMPPEVQRYLRRFLEWVVAAFRTPRCTILVDEADGAGVANDLYLGARCLATAPTVRLRKPRESHIPVASLPDRHTTHDTFRGVRVSWTATSRSLDRGGGGGYSSPYGVYGRSKKKGTDEQSAAQLATAVVGTRESISLSRVLNFVDGLWSSCVGERLIDGRLDDALLRPGRMDKKIKLGYCRGPALRVLAKNYLGVGDEGREDADADPDTVNGLMAEAEGLLDPAAGVRITPADIAEVFMGCDGAGATAALTKLVDELRRRRDDAAAAGVPPGEWTNDETTD
nr:unnamed protein product [Digitaria exilis]